jgi:hypothetical protein
MQQNMEFKAGKPVYRVDINEEENYNETLLNPHQPLNMQPLTHRNRLLEDGANHSSSQSQPHSLNSSAQSFY